MHFPDALIFCGSPAGSPSGHFWVKAKVKGEVTRYAGDGCWLLDQGFLFSFKKCLISINSLLSPDLEVFPWPGWERCVNLIICIYSLWLREYILKRGINGDGPCIQGSVWNGLGLGTPPTKAVSSDFGWTESCMGLTGCDCNEVGREVRSHSLPHQKVHFYWLHQPDLGWGFEGRVVVDGPVGIVVFAHQFIHIIDSIHMRWDYPCLFF